MVIYYANSRNPNASKEAIQADKNIGGTLVDLVCKR